MRAVLCCCAVLLVSITLFLLCSTPVWAGILSLVNAERLAAGKAPLGFVNPLLYARSCEVNAVVLRCASDSHVPACTQQLQDSH